MCCGTSRDRWVAAPGAPFHLGQAELGVVGGHDDVGVADQSDTAADAESVDRRDDRDRALVDRPERVAAAVGVDQRGEALGVLHLLDVHAGVEAAALGPQDHHVRRSRPAAVMASASSNQPGTGWR
jgi:hypothetical protein